MLPASAELADGAAPGSGLFSEMVGFVQDHLVLLLLAVALVVALSAGRAVRNSAPEQLDPQRMFNADQRRIGAARAGNRCEMDGVFPWTRCKRTGTHGDHHFPWSKGGATSMANFVWACARCNTSKGAKVPTHFQTSRIARRRRKYFPAAIPTRPGQRARVHVGI